MAKKKGKGKGRGWHGNSAGHAAAASTGGGKKRRKKVGGRELASAKASVKKIRKAHRADSARRKRNYARAIKAARG